VSFKAGTARRRDGDGAAAAKYNRAFDSMKAPRAGPPGAPRLAGHDAQRSWHQLPGPAAMGDFQRDPGLVRNLRIDRLLPFGKSEQVTLSRQAAEMAAAIGDGKTKVVNALARRPAGDERPGGLGRPAARTRWPLRPGHGNAQRAPDWPPPASRSPALWSKSSASGTAAPATCNAHPPCSARGGDTSKLMGVGFDEQMLSRFQRSNEDDRTPEQQGAFAKLGLDPDKLETESLKDALGQVAGGFDQLGDPADKASAAMTLFGRAGADVIATLGSMQPKPRSARRL